jgi:hypothetical protein
VMALIDSGCRFYRGGLGGAFWGPDLPGGCEDLASAGDAPAGFPAGVSTVGGIGAGTTAAITWDTKPARK